MIPAVKSETVEHLAAAPRELWPAITKAWMIYKDLPGMETPVKLAVMCGCWHHDHGFPIRNLAAALTDVTHPKHAQKIRFGHDVISELGSILCPPAPKREETVEEQVMRIGRANDERKARAKEIA